MFVCDRFGSHHCRQFDYLLLTLIKYEGAGIVEVEPYGYGPKSRNSKSRQAKIPKLKIPKSKIPTGSKSRQVKIPFTA